MMRAALILVVAASVMAALFTLAPGVDLAVSAPFYDAAQGRWAGAGPAAEALRGALWTFLEGAAVLFASLLAVALLLGRRAAVPARLWAFAVLALALGPGLAVNGVLKEVWGRARPRAVEAFGGGAEFTPALRPAAECATNCSFVSGEVAGWTVLALAVWLICGRRLTGPGRAAVATALAGAVGMVAALRIAAGGHFLSDTVFAVLLSLAVTLVLWTVLRGGEAAARLTWPALRADLARLVGRAPK